MGVRLDPREQRAAVRRVTRLAGVQRSQFEQWQREYETSLPAPPNRLDVLRARAGLHAQTTLRRGAYSWLRLKGSFHTKHED